MEIKKLKLESRDTSLKNNILRSNGKTPVVLYAKSKNITAALNTNEFTKLAQKSYTCQVFEFESENKDLNGLKAIIKEIQQDVIKKTVLHVDFQMLIEDQKVNVNIPVRAVGVSVGVKDQGGVLAVSCYDITVECLPKDIPSPIDIDISNLELGQKILTSEISLPDGVLLKSNAKETFANVVTSRVSKTLDEESAEIAEIPGADATAAATEEAPAADKG